MPLSIEFKNGFINIVEAKLKKGVISVSNTHTVRYPDEWIDAMSILNMSELHSLLRKELDVMQFKEKSCYLCINNTSIIYRELQVPKLDSKKLPLLVRSEMMEVLNLSPDYIMDYVILEELVDQDTNEDNYRVLAVAMQKSAIESYIELCKLLNLKLISIDSATNSVLKLVSLNPEIVLKEQVILADVGNGHLRLYLFEQGKYVLSRNTRLISYSDTKREEIIGVVEDNINKMIQFSYTRGLKSGIKQIVLFGNDDLLSDVKDRVVNGLIVPCEIFQKPDFVNVEGEFQTLFLNAYGTLLRK